MSQNNNNNPRDFRVVKNERAQNIHLDEEQENFDEETSMEYVAPMEGSREAPYNKRSVEERTEGRGVGVFALILSVFSLFFWPFLLGTVGIILGIMSVARNHKGLGYTAIAIGALSVIVSLFGAPFITY